MSNYGLERQRICEEIRSKCKSCEYGLVYPDRVKCNHFLHPGIVGGFGTDWVLRCEHYLEKIEK